MQSIQIPNPCYVLEEEKLRDNLKLIKALKEEAGVEVILALKGFALWSVFPIVAEYLDGATASSLNEAQLINDEMGCLAHTYATAYDPTSFERIQDLSSHLTFNSLGQYERFKSEMRTSIQYGLRINPETSLVETPLYDPCAPGSRLGISADKLPDTLPEGISGLHFHVLCENGPEELAVVLNSLEEKFSKQLSQVKWLNMGGGHLMTRRGFDQAKLIALLKAFKQKWDLDIILEPGSAIAWETGYLKAKVLDIVEQGGIRTAMLNVSFTAHMPDCLEMPYRPVVIGAEIVDEPLRGYRLGGCSCLAGDFIGNYDFGKALQLGQEIFFEDMIHYTLVKTNMFNGVEHPSIGMIGLDGTFSLIRSFDFADYKGRMG